MHRIEREKTGEYLTVGDFARKYDLNPTAVYVWVRRGLIPALFLFEGLSNKPLIRIPQGKEWEDHINYVKNNQKKVSSERYLCNRIVEYIRRGAYWELEQKKNNETKTVVLTIRMGLTLPTDEFAAEPIEEKSSEEISNVSQEES